MNVIKDTEQQVYQMFDDAVQEEKDGQHIYFRRSMIGLSEKLLRQFVEHMANRRMKDTSNLKYEQKSNFSYNTLVSSRG